MSKKRRSPSKSSKASVRPKQTKSLFSRVKKQARSIGVLLVLVAGGAFGLSAYRDSYAISHDLSVIGNGKPVIVQVHDPKCPKCRKLMSNTKTALKQHRDTLLFRIADIKTPAGRTFQREFEASTITLILFDKHGQRQTVLSGVKPVATLEKEFDRLASRARG